MIFRALFPIPTPETFKTASRPTRAAMSVCELFQDPGFMMENSAEFLPSRSALPLKET